MPVERTGVQSRGVSVLPGIHRRTHETVLYGINLSPLFKWLEVTVFGKTSNVAETFPNEPIVAPVSVCFITPQTADDGIPLLFTDAAGAMSSDAMEA
ncbi:hypothetical protein SAMN04487857_1141 [Pseudomonas sp. ok272]|nr:hypothetical protein SAMN04487857_1141 [Pseudomonas sp. ok272]